MNLGNRKEHELAIFFGARWKMEHEGSIAHKISRRGKPRQYNHILRSLSPVDKSNLLEDSKGTQYKYLRNGSLVRVGHKLRA